MTNYVFFKMYKNIKLWSQIFLFINISFVFVIFLFMYQKTLINIKIKRCTNTNKTKKSQRNRWSNKFPCDVFIECNVRCAKGFVYKQIRGVTINTETCDNFRTTLYQLLKARILQQRARKKTKTKSYIIDEITSK